MSLKADKRPSKANLKSTMPKSTIKEHFYWNKTVEVLN